MNKKDRARIDELGQSFATDFERLSTHKMNVRTLHRLVELMYNFAGEFRVVADDIESRPKRNYKRKQK